MIFFTRRLWSSAANPVSPFPALLLTMVRSRAPCSMRASIRWDGMPADPNPPIMTVEPWAMPATTASGDSKTLETNGALCLAHGQGVNQDSHAGQDPTSLLLCVVLQTASERPAGLGSAVIARGASGVARWSSRWVPSAFVIACLLTLVTFAMVLVVARKSPAEAVG